MFFSTFLIACLSIHPGNMDCSAIDKIRNDFHGITSEESLEEFMNSYSSNSCPSSIPYIASATMRQAEYVFFPLTKLSYFNEGKEMLESFISKYPTNIEARYVRILVQSNVPRILNYSANIDTDMAYILSHIDKASLSPEYKNRILSIIKKIDH